MAQRDAGKARKRQSPSFGNRLRDAIRERETLPFVGVYDVYSASLAAQQFDTLFLSGFSFGASFYGLPDAGFIAWTDIVASTQRIRVVVPTVHLLVDMDDGYGDTGVAAHAASMLESAGASGIILEDQLRPKKCGHLDGKQVMELDGYLEKLDGVLAARRDLVVIARTDATDPDERLRRAAAFDRTAADAILVDGLSDLGFMRQLRDTVRKPLVVNHIAGGKSPARSWSELREAGVSIVIHSTPCLFAAHQAIEEELNQLRSQDGRLPERPKVTLEKVNKALRDNLAARSTLKS